MQEAGCPVQEGGGHTGTFTLMRQPRLLTGSTTQIKVSPCAAKAADGIKRIMKTLELANPASAAHRSSLRYREQRQKKTAPLHQQLRHVVISVMSVGYYCCPIRGNPGASGGALSVPGFSLKPLSAVGSHSIPGS